MRVWAFASATHSGYVFGSGSQAQLAAIAKSFRLS
jgi:hypothetical protein